MAQTLWSDRTGNTGLKLEITAANALTWSGGNGSAIVTATGGTLTVNTDYVATAKYDGTNLSLQLNNGTPVTAACTLSAGTAAITYAKENGAASGFFKGRIYEQTYTRNSVPSTAQEAQDRTWVAAQQGQVL